MTLNALYIIIIRYFFIMITLLFFTGLWMFIEHTSLSIEGVMGYYAPKSFFGLLETVSPHLFGMSLVVFILTHFFAVIKGINQRKFWLFGLFALMLVSNLSGFFIDEGSLVSSVLKLGSTLLMIVGCFWLMSTLIKFSRLP